MTHEKTLLLGFERTHPRTMTVVKKPEVLTIDKLLGLNVLVRKRLPV